MPADPQLVVKEFEKTLNELKSLGITPIVFSPPPANGLNLGQCLAKAEWRGLNLENCDFAVSEISQHRLVVHDLLQIVAKKNSVVFLDDLMCSDVSCRTHFDNVFLFRDSGHLSNEGSAALGKKFDFYRISVEQ